MIKIFKLLIFLMQIIVLYWASFPFTLHAEHKLCDGEKINEIQDKTYTVNFDPQTQLITINGSLEIGVVAAFDRLIKKYPMTTGVVFDSKGGNVYQARGLAVLIDSHALNTYVINACYSACPRAYLAGKKRFLSSDAKLGFHRYHLDAPGNNPFIDIEKEQHKDLLFYQKQIPSTEFVEKIFASDCTDIWIPDTKELFNAGAIHSIINIQD